LVDLLRDNRNLNSIGFNVTLGNQNATPAAAALAAGGGGVAAVAALLAEPAAMAELLAEPVAVAALLADPAAGAALLADPADVAAAAAAAAATAAFLLPALLEGLRHNSCVEKVDLRCGSDRVSGDQHLSYDGPAAMGLAQALREHNTVLKVLDGIKFAPAECDAEIARLLQLNRSGRHFLLHPDQAPPQRMPRVLAKIGADAGAPGLHHFLAHMARERVVRLASGLGLRRTEAAAPGPPGNDGDD
jgi:hypothetical protein